MLSDSSEALVTIERPLDWDARTAAPCVMGRCVEIGALLLAMRRSAGVAWRGELLAARSPDEHDIAEERLRDISQRH